MKKKVFITKTASFFPNNPVGNDEMEDFLGLVGGKRSRVRSIILRQNGIKNRYYALDKKQQITHTNAEMAALSIKKMLDEEERGQGTSPDMRDIDTRPDASVASLNGPRSVILASSGDIFVVCRMHDKLVGAKGGVYVRAFRQFRKCGVLYI